jgi:tetratricopeptide (TPR) repeat protein
MESVSEAVATKRGLILHDGLAFVSLIAISVILFVVTLGLFRSFEDHRADLAVRWGERGKAALAQGHPNDAVTALRTALSYAPDERADQMLLAQALAEAGHTEEATNYFLNLWDARPGDGFINLQLARLARKKGSNKEATDYYRASIFGSWEGDGVVRRRDVRLELVDFLIQQKELPQARNELFTIAGNAPGDPGLNLLLAKKFREAQDPSDALSFDQKALTADPHNERALDDAGRLAYGLGRYPLAERLIRKALEEKPDAPDAQQLSALLADATGMEDLTLSPDQPAQQRVDHILAAAAIAQSRLKACSVEPVPVALSELAAQWTGVRAGIPGGPRGVRKMLLEDETAEDTWTGLIYQTEQTTALLCGVPKGKDALLLKLADAEKGSDGR